MTRVEIEPGEKQVRKGENRMWYLRLYPTGTQIVIQPETEKSHYYVWGRGNKDKDQHRQKVSEEITSWLNGGEEPAWLGIDYTDPFTYTLPDGQQITAIGPYYDMYPPHSIWREHPKDNRQRAELIRCLCERRRPE